MAEFTKPVSFRIPVELWYQLHDVAVRNSLSIGEYIARYFMLNHKTIFPSDTMKPTVTEAKKEEPKPVPQKQAVTVAKPNVTKAFKISSKHAVQNFLAENGIKITLVTLKNSELSKPFKIGKAEITRIKPHTWRIVL